MCNVWLEIMCGRLGLHELNKIIPVYIISSHWKLGTEDGFRERVCLKNKENTCFKKLHAIVKPWLTNEAKIEKIELCKDGVYLFLLNLTEYV